jgi:hypothetical protein
MAVMSGKVALLELLKQEGVRVMFGNPGTTELLLMDALAAETAATLARLHAAAEAGRARTPIQPLALLQAIGSMLPAEAVVIDETVSSGAGCSVS